MNRDEMVEYQRALSIVPVVRFPDASSFHDQIVGPLHRDKFRENLSK
jgi:hypothetical protein